MLTPPSARAWQSLPSVPGLSSRLIVNSFAVGMLGNLLQLCLGNAGRAFLGNRKSPGFEWKNAGVRAQAFFGDDACSMTTDIFSESDFVNERFIWTRELQVNSRRNPSFHSLLFGLS